MARRRSSQRKGDRRPPEAPPASSRSGSGTRFALLLAVIAAVVGAGAAVWLGTRDHTPLNLIVITLDTTRADALGCYGATPAGTPVLDGLAARGVRFEHCETCTPLTLPAHSTIFTSTWPYVHGVRRNGTNRLGEGSTTLAEMLKPAGFATEAVVATGVLEAAYGLNQGFDHYSDVETGTNPNPAAVERKGDQVTDEAILALQRVAGQRFFLWAHYYDPHTPYESSEHPDTHSPEAYADEVAFMDTQVGRLLDEVRRLGLEGNTLIAVSGDHGEGLMDHGEAEHGYFLYETTLRVPFFLVAPGRLDAGRTVESTVRTVDLVPTVLELLEVPAPAGMQGASLLEVCKGRRDPHPRPAYGETHSPSDDLGLSTLTSLTRDGWKYIHSGEPELYDLGTDPDETRNLASAEPQRAAAMREELAALLAGGPASPEGSGETVELTEAQQEAFRSLGYVSGGGDESSAATADRTLATRGDNPSRHAEAIETYNRSLRVTSAQDYEQAVPMLEDVLMELPEARSPLRDLEMCLGRLGRDDELLPFLQRVLERHPDASRLRVQVAQRLVRSGQREEGFAQLEEAAARAPDVPDVLFESAQALLAQNRLDLARERFERTLALDPVQPKAWYGLSQVAARQDSIPRAVECLRQALALDPESPQLRRELQRLTSQSGS